MINNTPLTPSKSKMSNLFISNDSIKNNNKVISDKLVRSYSSTDRSNNNIILNQRSPQHSSSRSTYKSMRFFPSNYDSNSHDNVYDINEVDKISCNVVQEDSTELDESIIDMPIKYPLDKLEIIHHDIKLDLNLDLIHNLNHIADGSNAKIYTGKYNNNTVVIKIIKESSILNPIAIREFEYERDILLRLDHPNIIKLLGYGETPRKFLVLEYLQGGTLGSKIDNNLVKQSSSGEFFHSYTYAYLEFLYKAKDLADAFYYLHYKVNKNVIIMHRDLKPDNVGFTADGTLKLFDFGLCTVVKKRSYDSEVYEMTGNTGSLRYMAPEVALNKPYNEKVDVYSYGILLWQSLCDKIPFNGMSKDDMYKYVYEQSFGLKPKSTWSEEFVDFLNSCWSSNIVKRPNFQTIIQLLDNFISNEDKLNTENMNSCCKTM